MRFKLTYDRKNKLWWATKKRKDWHTYRGTWLRKKQFKHLHQALWFLIAERIR